jgi:hypothetical protein
VLYEEHFGLNQRPFGETVSPSAFVALPSRDTVLRRLRYGLEHGQGPGLLFGPPGVGRDRALEEAQALLEREARD